MGFLESNNIVQARAAQVIEAIDALDATMSMRLDVLHAQAQPICERSGNLIHKGRHEGEAGLQRWIAFARVYSKGSNSRHAQGLRRALADLDDRTASREQGG